MTVPVSPTNREVPATRRSDTAAQQREFDALELHMAGWADIAIADHLGVLAGSIKAKRTYAVRQLIQNALVTRGERMPPVVEAARQLYLARLEAIVGAYLPRAVGQGKDSEGNDRTPDPRAADVTIKALDRIAAAQGVQLPPRQHEHKHTVKLDPDDVDVARARVLADLAAQAAKQVVIDGQLAEQGTALDAIEAGPLADWRPPPPPTIKENA